ncbi:unnamed protein product [Clavelina lepadiformis]|uniref:Uncharacterized protein n=1 Tax=Clavelina lepadiformis TaxID=159417 RepID=A0ABP0FTW2_CLALP
MDWFLIHVMVIFLFTWSFLDPSDVTHLKQTIEANPQVEPHTDISEVTNQSNALNTEIPSTSND